MAPLTPYNCNATTTHESSPFSNPRLHVRINRPPKVRFANPRNRPQAIKGVIMSDSEETTEGNPETCCSKGDCETACVPGDCCVQSLCLNTNGSVQLKAKGKALRTNAGHPSQVHVAILPPGTNQIPTSPPKTTLTAPVEPASGYWNFHWGSDSSSIGPAECNRINYVVFWFEYRFENPMTGQVITYYSLEARSVIPCCSNLPACAVPVAAPIAAAAELAPVSLIAAEGGPVPSPKTKKRAKKK